MESERRLCHECPHHQIPKDTPSKISVVINGEPGPHVHPCHMNPERDCQGSRRRLDVIRTGAEVDETKTLNVLLVLDYPS